MHFDSGVFGWILKISCKILGARFWNRVQDFGRTVSIFKTIFKFRKRTLTFWYRYVNMNTETQHFSQQQQHSLGQTCKNAAACKKVRTAIFWSRECCCCFEQCCVFVFVFTYRSRTTTREMFEQNAELPALTLCLKRIRSAFFGARHDWQPFSIGIP